MRQRRQGLLSRLLRRFRERIGIKTVLVRNKEPLEWDNGDARMLRWLLRQPAGQKLVTMMDDAVICAYLDLKPRPYCEGMTKLRDFILSLQGQETPPQDEGVGHFQDSNEWSTLPSDFFVSEEELNATRG